MTELTRKTRALLIPLALGMALTACGGGGGGGSTSGSTTTTQTTTKTTLTQADLEGLWDMSIDYTPYGQDVKDEFYVYIADDGEEFAYDYQNDSMDLGPNCYETYKEDLNSIYQVNADGSVTLFTESEATSGVYDETSVTIVMSEDGNSMTLSTVDVNDLNGNGSTTDLLTQTASRITNMTVAELAVCSDSDYLQ